MSDLKPLSKDDWKCKSHIITLSLNLNSELGLTSVIIGTNTTSLPNDSELLKKVSIAILRALDLNKEDILVQDLLSELNNEL